MYHCVAVRADRNQIRDRINLILCAYRSSRNDVVHMNEALSQRPEDLFEAEAGM